MDYEDLIKRLRDRSELMSPHHGEEINYDGSLMQEAANAIEKLEILANNYRKALEAMK